MSIGEGSVGILLPGGERVVLSSVPYRQIAGQEVILYVDVLKV